jgi:hypothetical protein
VSDASASFSRHDGHTLIEGESRVARAAAETSKEVLMNPEDGSGSILEDANTSQLVRSVMYRYS